VRASDGDAASHAAVLLTDALSTASLPGADRRRVVLIRHLALGRISSRASAASLALHVERAAQAITSGMMTYDAPGAASANAVSFPDRATAIVALARRHAAGALAVEWFWPRVVAGWTPAASSADRWLRLVAAAHNGPDAAIVAAAIVDEAIRAGAVDDLLSSIPAGDGARWLRAEGWPQGSLAANGARSLSIVGPALEVVRRWSAEWTPADDRLVWFATMTEVTSRRAAVADPRLPARIAAAIQRVAEAVTVARVAPIAQRSGADGPRARGASSVVDDADRATPTARMPASARAVRSSPQAHARDEDEVIERGDVHATRAQGGSMRVPCAWPEHGDEPQGIFTGFAGLFLVVPVLQRLDFDAFLMARATLLDEAFPQRLLRFIGRRAGMPANDPLARCFDDEVDAEPEPSSRDTAIGSQFQDVAREMLASPTAPVTSLLDLWLMLVRRWCRRQARIGVATLVRRPGRVHLSRTHVDVLFPLSQLDVRVRRVALDVNPGWVPWMARIVEFKYEEHGAW
jgi:hypothetical protein